MLLRPQIELSGVVSHQESAVKSNFRSLEPLARSQLSALARARW
jgi:hypothetical protein